MDEMKNENIDQQPNTQPEDNGTQGDERLFTQTEVDRIVKDRLARAKATPKEPTEAEIRDQELTARESRLSCREYLMDQGYPAELLDVIDTSDIEKFKTKADTVSCLLNSMTKAAKAEPSMRAEMKRRIGLERDIPEDLAIRLVGETEADLYRDAEVMRKIMHRIKGPAPLYNPESAFTGIPNGFKKDKHEPRKYGPSAMYLD